MSNTQGTKAIHEAIKAVRADRRRHVVNRGKMLESLLKMLYEARRIDDDFRRDYFAHQIQRYMLQGDGFGLTPSSMGEFVKIARANLKRALDLPKK